MAASDDDGRRRLLFGQMDGTAHGTVVGHRWNGSVVPKRARGFFVRNVHLLQSDRFFVVCVVGWCAFLLRFTCGVILW